MPLFISQYWIRRLPRFISTLTVSAILTSAPSLANTQGKEHPVANSTSYRSIQVDGLSIFYREAGPKDAPTLLLLHGLPSSSRMFEPLFAACLIGIISSRPIIPVSDTATGPIPRNLPTPSITSPRS